MDGEHAFLKVVRRGDAEAVRSMLRGNPQLAASVDERGVAVICLAAYQGRMDLVRMIGEALAVRDVFALVLLGEVQELRALVARDPEAVRRRTQDGFTALHFAAFFAQPEAMAVLLAAGADANAVADNAMRVRPLHSALAQRDGESATRMVRLLLGAGADVEGRQAGGFRPLHNAAAAGHLEAVRLLLQTGADKDSRGDDGRRAYDFAVERHQEEVTAILRP
ncbi:MAG: ankyrin repeat domain-containing protein [Planctomycetes bacterium]|nr:ankyrin repeat domain-containing protein [Planctomycetota bacterium]